MQGTAAIWQSMALLSATQWWSITMDAAVELEL